MLDEYPIRPATRVGPADSRRAKPKVGAGSSDGVDSPPNSADQLGRDLLRHRAFLAELAARYNWWQTPAVALRFPARLVAQVMDIGTFEDIRRMAEDLGEDSLRQVLQHAEAGQLNARSWHYWHHRLNQVKPGRVPPMPRRRIG